MGETNAFRPGETLQTASVAIRRRDHAKPKRPNGFVREHRQYWDPAMSRMTLAREACQVRGEVHMVHRQVTEKNHSNDSRGPVLVHFHRVYDVRASSRQAPAVVARAASMHVNWARKEH